MQTHELNQLQWLILPGRPDEDPTRLHLHDQAFCFWREFWLEVFQGNGVEADIRSDDLCRQEMISLLLHRDQIVGLQCHSIYQLNSKAHVAHTYFQKLFSADYIRQVSNRNIDRALSMEYLSVDQNWRTHRLGVSLGAVLIGLGLKLATEFAVDGVVAAARADLPVARHAYEQGAETILAAQMRFNTPCDLILFPNGSYRLPECDVTSALIESLWKKRRDLRIESASLGGMYVAA